ncbi:MAG TPA: single-stranded-DNA-specific exonuclease RecJ [Candidatus Acidoferrum sp.]|nr:single-stranded-DNA-specific exonuclease RecJ [Candidatus Acidoferrum sp.]
MRWLAKSADSSQVDSLSSALSSKDPVVARLLVMRGITDPGEAERFLAPSLSHLHTPYVMSGMKTAVDRLEAAIERKESILIYGDYDVDGTTAIVILKTAIELCGGAADFHVPHRIREGYGMRDEVIERAAAEGVKLIISVDTGIRAFAAGDTAERLGVDLIVTDHHLPGQDGVPKALAVLNPNQPGCEYPCKALCGAGVAFKLAQALMERRLPQSDHARMLHSFMKVVAIATIADAVPLCGENRVFAKLGLDALRSPRNIGLRALLEVSQLAVSRPLTSGEIAFRIAPRLNAAGRMDVARDVVELFSVKDPERARELANRLDKLNAERQEEERRILDSIAQRVEQEPALREAFCVVIDGDGWHRGVIGITATRVVERYGRPALIISRDGEEAHGSGRSISGFHLLDALESCSSLFSRYGGHAHAVGFALPSANVVGLRSHLDLYARERLTLADFEPSLRYDAELGLDQVTPEFFQALNALEPFGMGNPEPVFVAHGVRLLAPPKMIKDKHVKLRLAAASGNGQPEPTGWRRALGFDALGWQMAERAQAGRLLPGDTIDIAFSVDHNDHPEYGGLELSLRDFQTQTKAVATAGIE